jgi:hypothetical protein
MTDYLSAQLEVCTSLEGLVCRDEGRGRPVEDCAAPESASNNVHSLCYCTSIHDWVDL